MGLMIKAQGKLGGSSPRALVKRFCRPARPGPFYARCWLWSPIRLASLVGAVYSGGPGGMSYMDGMACMFRWVWKGASNSQV